MEGSKESYNLWIQHKLLKDKAQKYLEHITKPCNMDESDEDSVTPSVRWEEVGRALKGVDRGLLDEWMKWSNEFASSSRCRILWESFSPISCDVHATSSAIRDIFLKLLHRKEVNYKAAFMRHCERKHSKAVREGNADDDMKEEDKLETYSSLSKRDFANFLKDLGIVLQPEETERVVEYFDKNGDGCITIKEFLDVTGEERGLQCHGDTEKALKDVCMWETVCHECGMLNAFQLVIAPSSNGGKDGRMRAELPGHVKRRQLSRFDCKPILAMRQVKEIAPTSCDFSSWGDSNASKCVAKLEILSVENRERSTLKKLVTEGSPPDAPILLRDDDEALDPTTMLLLRWNPPAVSGNNGPAFYVLETSGAGRRQINFCCFKRLMLL